MDSFLLLAPIFLVLVVALLSFTGCDLFFPLKEPSLIPPTPKIRINCGGPAVTDVELAWEADTNPDGSARTNPGNPVLDLSDEIANPIYNTCRLGDIGADVSYVRAVGQGEVVVNLKFAWFFSTLNDFLPFAIQVSGDGTNNTADDDFNRNIPFFTVSSPAGTTFDPPPIMLQVNEAGNLAITFRKALNQGKFPYVNAIEISTNRDLPA
jgi:hypothetical protein